MVSKKLKLSTRRSKRSKKSKRSSKYTKRSSKYTKRSTKRTLCLYDWNCPSGQRCDDTNECVKKSTFTPIVNIYRVHKPVDTIYANKLLGSNLYTKRTNGENCNNDIDCYSKFCSTVTRKCITAPPPPSYQNAIGPSPPYSAL